MPTDPREAKDLFIDLVTNVAPEGWDEALTGACDGNSDLRDRVRALLNAHAHPNSFLEQPAITEVPGLGDSSSVAEKPGTIIGPYKLLQKIGEGGMGVVFMAEQAKPIQRLVALKIIKAGMDTRQVIARFEAERQALALMDHPNIARVLDAGATESGRPYFVMELVKGVPITKYCDEKNVSLRDRLDLVLPVCHAVQHAHQKGIIHRDLKPSNVLVAEYDHAAVPKVIDFGVAKATGPKLTDRTMFTEFGQVLGTVEYMSPEQAKLNQLDIDTRSDIYSLGVLLYELLTGETPFDRQRLRSAAFDEVLRIIREEEPPKPSTRISSAQRPSSVATRDKTDARRLSGLLKGELDWIVMKALEKDRARRYETANAFAADIERYLRNEAVQAGPPSATYRLRKLARRYQAALTVVVAFVLLLITASAISTWQAIRATRAEHEVTHERDNAIAEKQQKEAALIQKQEALAERQRALDEATQSKKVAQERLVNGLIAEGDSLVNSGRASQARDAYWQALDLSQQLGIPQFAVRCGLLESYVIGAPPLMGREGRHTSVGGFELPSSVNPRLFTRTLAISSDGRTAAAGARSGRVYLWDLATGLPIRTLYGHSRSARCVAFSPDGGQLLSGSTDGALILWDVHSGAEIRTLLGHSSGLNGVAFSSDGKIAVSGARDSAVIIWDVATGSELRRFRAYNPVIAVAISPDGATVIATGTGGGIIEAWDLNTGRKIARLLDEASALQRLAFSPDGKMILAGGLSHNTSLWDFTTRKVVRRFGTRGRTSTTTDLAYSPNGKFALCAGSDGVCRLYDVSTGDQVGSFSGFQGEVAGVAFLPNSRFFLSADEQGSLKLWDLQADRGTELAGHTDRVVGLAISPDGRLALSGGLDDTIRLWDVATGKSMAEMKTTSNVFSTMFLPDGHTAVSGEKNGAILFWDIATRNIVRRLSGHTNIVTCLALAPDHRSIASASSDTTIRLWNIDSGTTIRTFHGHQFAVRSIAFSPDGKQLLSGSFDTTMKLWDVESGREIRTFTGHEHWVQSVAFSPDGRRAASGSWDNTLALWDLKTGKRLSVERANSVVTAVAFAPDGATVRASCLDRTISSWDIDGSGEMRTLGWQDDSLASGLFCPDGKTALLGSVTGLIWRRDLDRADQYRAFDERLPQARQALTRNRNDGEALREFGRWFAFRRIDDWSAKFLEKAKAAGAEVPAIELARCYWRLNRRDDAIRELKHAKAQHEAPDDYLTLCLKALETKATADLPANSAAGR